MPDQHNIAMTKSNFFNFLIYKRSCTVLLFCKVSFSKTLWFINKYLATLERPVILLFGMSC